MSRYRDEFMATLARAMPDASTYTVCELGRKLIRQSRTITRHAVNLCNVPDYQPIYDKAIERAEKAIRELLKDTPIKSFETGGDPRGACLKLHLPDGRSNTFGDDGYAVPC